MTLSKTTGRLALRLANADVLPMRFENFADNVALYAGEVMELLEDTRASTDRNNRLVAMNAYGLAADPTQIYVPPEAEDDVPYLSFAPLQNAVRRLETSAKALDVEMQRVMETGATAAEAQALNRVLKTTERLMTNDEGPAATSMVSASDLRTRLPHRLRGEDATGDSRGHRTEGLGRGHRANRPGGGHAESGLRSPRAGDADPQELVSTRRHAGSHRPPRCGPPASTQ